MISGSPCRIRAARLLTALIALLVVSLTATAQEQGQYDRGTPPQHAAGVSSFGGYTSADLGTINLGNGSLNFKLPLGTVGGRGFWLPLTLNYSNKVWSGRRSRVFISDPAPGHMEAAAWAAYNDYTEDIFNAVAPGWTAGAAPFLKARGVPINSINNPNGCTDYSWVLVKLTLVLPDRGEVELRDDQLEGAPVAAQTFGPTGCRTQDGYRGKRWHATDGSGTIFINDVDNGIVNGDLSGTVITSDGTRYHFVNASSGNLSGSAYLNNIARCDWVTDRNGNKVSIGYPTGSKVVYTDQLGRQTIVEFSVSDSQFPGETLALRVTLPGYSGSPHYFKVRTALMSQSYRSDYNPVLPVYNGAYPTGVVGTELFAASYEAGMERIDSKPVLTQLVLPDGRAVSFKYNTFGEVAEVQMPTGGKVQYEYATSTALPSGNSLAAEVIASGAQAGGNVTAVDRAVIARRTYPDGSNLEGTWSYSYQGDKTEVRCTSASGTLLLDGWHYFLAAQRFLTGSTSTGVDGTGYSLWSTGVQRRSESRDTNLTTVLGASEQDWSQRAAITTTIWSTGYPVQQIANDNRVTEERRYLDDGSMSKTITSYDATIAATNHINNPSNVFEYDFDQTLKRQTTTAYLTGGNYTGTGVNTVNLLSLPIQQSVFDGPTGTELTRASYEYDNYTGDGNHAALVDNGAVTGHDSAYGISKTVRGNQTQLSRMVDSSTFLYSYPRYDTLGNVISMKDPRTNVTTISYQDDFGDGSNPGSGSSGTFGATYALPTLITSPPPNPGEPTQTARTQFDFSTGLMTGFKDRNGVIAQTVYNDAFDRPTQIKSALGTSLENHAAMYYAPAVVFGVNLANNDVLTSKDQVGIDDSTLRSWTKTDGFGRTVESWTRDPQADVRVVTSYDGLGRVSKTSNPFRIGETQYDTTTGYDLAGRVRTVTTADNAVVTTAYNGARILVIDQAGKQRISKTDGLGRLTEVWEVTAADSATESVTFPGSSASAGYRTTYSYDALDDLTQATQKIGMTPKQTRTFYYDGLKRLKQAINPESGTINYTYDANSNLQTKLDARLITTTYNYDALNRVTSRAYTNDPQGTPAVSYKYDGQALPSGYPTGFARGSSTGRLVAVTLGTGSAGNYTGYDQLGRANVSYQQTDSQNYGFTNYSYNLASEMTSQTYPSGKVVQTEYDSAGRVAGVRNQGASWYYAGAAATDTANRIQYASHGAVSGMKLGNGKWEHTAYDPKRLQPTQIGLGTSSSDSSLLKLDYSYGAANNNGNVVSQTIAIGSTVMTDSFGYDSLNRLSSASETGGANWSQNYGYDRFGNRWYSSGSYLPNTTLTPQGQAAFNQSTNKLTASLYDNAGNQTQDAASSGFTYDAENRQISSSVGGMYVTYGYDGDGRRVKKVAGTSTTIFVYNGGGQLIAEYTSPDQVSSNGLSYLTSDHLGSTRVVTDGSGNVRSRHDYLPFGEEIGTDHRPTGLSYGSTDGVRQKFTQKERDNESGLDYFKARYYASPQGRFTSVDPGNAGADPDDAQSWNGYAYGRNNPLLYVDPTGEDYDLYDKDGKLLGRVKDASELDKKGYKYTGSEDNGNVLNFKGGYQARYVEGDPGGVQVHDNSGMTPLASGVFLELDRRAAASIKLIDIASQITLTPISIISGSGLFRAGAGLTTLATGAAEASSIRIGAWRLAHVLERHAAGGARTAGKSLFNGGEGEIVSLIREAGSVARVPQAGGKFARVVDAGRIIGVDRATGAPTSVYTVITNTANELVTAFPGRP